MAFYSTLQKALEKFTGWIGADELATKLTYASGSGAPGSAPSFIGQYYLDTAAGNWYKAKGTATSADWAITAIPALSAAELGVLDGVTAGTGLAAKAMILDANGNFTFPASHTFRRSPVALTATAAITALLHSNRPLVITGTAAAAYTLPAATGSGDKYEFIMGQVNTNGTTIVTDTPASVSMYGSINSLDVDAASQAAYFTVTAGGTDTITLNGTTTGGQIGDMVTLVDIAADKWAVWGQFRVPAGSNPASPFSSAA